MRDIEDPFWSSPTDDPFHYAAKLVCPSDGFLIAPHERKLHTVTKQSWSISRETWGICLGATSVRYTE